MGKNGQNRFLGVKTGSLTLKPLNFVFYGLPTPSERWERPSDLEDPGLSRFKFSSTIYISEKSIENTRTLYIKIE